MSIDTKDHNEVVPAQLGKRIRTALRKEFAPASVEMINIEDDVDETGEPSIAVRILLQDSERGKVEEIPSGAFLRALTSVNDLVFESGDKRVAHLFYIDGNDLPKPTPQ
jgi:hypothetical protein